MSAAAELRGDIMDQSLKAYYREFRRVVEASDVVLEVLDARDPLGCRCPQVEEAVLVSGTNKKLILVLNKIGKNLISCLFPLHITSLSVAPFSPQTSTSLLMFPFSCRFGSEGNC